MNSANADVIAERLERIERVLFGAPAPRRRGNPTQLELTVTQAAKRLGTSRRTVGHWATAGQIPGARKWRNVWYLPLEWVASEVAKSSEGPHPTTNPNPISTEQDPR